MIRIKNTSQYILNLRSPGTATAATNKDCVSVPFPCKILNLYATCSSGGTGSTSSIVDIHKNGTTIFATSVKITITPITGAVAYSTFTSQPTELAAGDILSMDIDQISTTLSNVMVQLLLSKEGPSGAEGNVADLDSVS
jgi:hypothetical protein